MTPHPIVCRAASHAAYAVVLARSSLPTIAFADCGDRLHAIEHLFEGADVVSGPEAVDCTLSGGAETTCFRIAVRPFPAGRETGPYCPADVADGPEQSGIWLERGEAFDAKGTFVAALPEFHDDPNWSVVDPDGTVNVTGTAEECAAAAPTWRWTG